MTRDNHPQNASATERIVFGGLGAGLIFLSLRRADKLGLLLGTSGALMLSSAAMGKGPYNSAVNLRRSKQDGGIQVQKAITIGVRPEQLYTFWRNFENLPKFMTHLQSVTVQTPGGTRSHWIANAPAGLKVEWDADITEDVPNERIAWRALEGAQVPNEGHVEFHEAPGGRGTELRVNLTYHPPGGTLGAGVARMFGEEPNQQITDDLRRLKRIIEIGQEPTTEGQSAGRKSPIGKAAAAMYDNRRTS
ncbi:SRPBCC family protein [Deinococcus maricopensis]|uniref:Cyclase/dehydrase n=1 Tax=Deinococcus maricopensis (strain DSM 21211 / LMG 22137 / NRRL B-23946 / LB-34) TaxID=709986 RepID=E8U862_DEIML|nr:SRPBCC family protein [Deinococcus maricopensis]ADV67251.1 cyclase/dehydrase [Deinococcus maricopensis DSM 21211]